MTDEAKGPYRNAVCTACGRANADLLCNICRRPICVDCNRLRNRRVDVARHQLLASQMISPRRRVDPPAQGPLAWMRELAAEIDRSLIDRRGRRFRTTATRLKRELNPVAPCSDHCYAQASSDMQHHRYARYFGQGCKICGGRSLIPCPDCTGGLSPKSPTHRCATCRDRGVVRCPNLL
ncbi:MAG: hypothetical protein H6707_19180 [Deltaproteobacteria bacterium]|nr:hypothetical protein [Deltaproteobacteria bacterium]